MHPVKILLEITVCPVRIRQLTTHILEKLHNTKNNLMYKIE